jgi:ubiquinone/menaquinone biosynthesis C-methylase UbiE
MTVLTPTRERIRSAWNAIAPQYDEVATPMNQLFAEEALRRVDVGPGVRFLDVACGSGALAIPAARRGARVIAVDLAPAMIERLIARACAERLLAVTGRQMNGESLEFPGDTFDVTASQNGISLFSDLKAGLHEAVRVTKPGGSVLIIAFGSPRRAEFIGFLLGALRAAVPGFTPPINPPSLPFQLADPDRLSRELAEAGLTDVRVETTKWEMTCRSADHLWDAVTASNPAAQKLAGPLGQEQRTEVKRVLDGMLRERSGGTSEAVLSNEMNIGIGRKP